MQICTAAHATCFTRFYLAAGEAKLAAAAGGAWRGVAGATDTKSCIYSLPSGLSPPLTSREKNEPENINTPPGGGRRRDASDRRGVWERWGDEEREVEEGDEEGWGKLGDRRGGGW